MKERTHILIGIYSKRHSMINNNSEIYSLCRHKTRFHRFPNNSTGTDESTHGQKSSLSTSNPENLETNSLDHSSSTSNSCSYPRTGPNPEPLLVCTTVPTNINYNTPSIISPILAILKPNLTCAYTCASDSRTIEI